MRAERYASHTRRRLKRKERANEYLRLLFSTLLRSDESMLNWASMVRVADRLCCTFEPCKKSQNSAPNAGLVQSKGTQDSQPPPKPKPTPTEHRSTIIVAATHPATSSSMPLFATHLGSFPCLLILINKCSEWNSTWLSLKCVYI